MANPISLDRPIIVFDGLCNLCSSSVRFILKNDHVGRILFAPLQSKLGARLLLANDIDPGDAVSFLLIKNEQAYTQTDAVLEIVKHLGTWKWLSVFRIVPRPLRDSLYRLVARNRYRWFGKRESCFVPSKAQKERFLDMDTT